MTVNVHSEPNKINFPITEAQAEDYSSYYFNDNVLNDSKYINERDKAYACFLVDISKDGSALRVTNTDISIIFHPVRL
jgi:hypothetical protein